MHRIREDLEAGLDVVRAAPKDGGRLELIVRRPEVDERQVLDEATLDTGDGLVGDDWRGRGSDETAGGWADPEEQIALMNARAIALVAGSKDRWSLAGDQLYIDFDISDENAPPGTRLAIGTAVIEITDAPHSGCSKFAARYGMAAARFVNSPVGIELHLRGVHARVVQAGAIRAGDSVRKVAPVPAATGAPEAV